MLKLRYVTVCYVWLTCVLWTSSTEPSHCFTNWHSSGHSRVYTEVHNSTATVRFPAQFDAFLLSTESRPVPGPSQPLHGRYQIILHPPLSKIKCSDCEASHPLSTRPKLTESVELFLNAHTLYYDGMNNSFRFGLAWTEYSGILCSFGRDAAF
jgi:hypothetical protein